jgi:hypothetical protein
VHGTAVTLFNDNNANRASMYRSLGVIACHINHMKSGETFDVPTNLLKSGEANPSTDATNCIAKLKSVTTIKADLFPDASLDEDSSKACPALSGYEDDIRNYGSLGFDKDESAWSPTTGKCDAVTNHVASPSLMANFISTAPGHGTYVLDASGCVKRVYRGETDGSCAAGWPTSPDLKTFQVGQGGILILMNDGTVRCVSNYASCTNKNSNNVGTVTGLPSASTDPVVQVKVGSENMLALTQSGQVFAWGKTRFDIVQRVGNDPNAYETPRLVTGLPANDPIVSIGLFTGYGAYHAAALTQSGQLWGWGSGTSHWCGPTLFGGRGPTPVRFPVSNLPADDNTIIDFSLGGYCELYVRTAGKRLFAKGQNDKGQSGNSAGNQGIFEVGAVVPGVASDPITFYTVGYKTGFIVTQSGKVFSLGSNWAGFLGLGAKDTDVHRVPTQIMALNGKKITVVSGTIGNVAALTNTGEVYIWGDEATSISSGPGQFRQPTPTLVAGITV